MSIVVTMKESESLSVMSNSVTPWTVHGILLSHNTGVCNCSLLQGIFTTQRSNLGLPHISASSYMYRKIHCPMSLHKNEQV